MRNRKENNLPISESTGVASSTPLYNSRIIDNYIKLIRRKYNHINIEELLDFAGMTLYEVADEGHWFTQAQINRFHEKLSLLTKNAFIAREAGRYAASPDAIGFMRPFVLGMVGPTRVFSIVGKVSNKFTRSTKTEAHIVASNKVELTATPYQNVQERPFQCENRMGFLEAIVVGFTNKLPTIEHPECVHKGGRTCRYHISWEKNHSSTWKKIRMITAVLPGLAALLSWFYIPDFQQMSFSDVSPFLMAWLAIIFLLSYIAVVFEKREVLSSLSHLHDSTNSLIEQININYNNAVMTNEVGQAISKKTNSSEILRDVIRIFKKRLNYDRGMILLSDREQKRLLFRAGYGYTEEQLKLLKETAFHLKKQKSKGVFVKAYREQQPFLVSSVDEITKDLSLRSINFAKRMGSRSFICCPIVCDGESMGILAVDNLTSKKPLVHSDISLLMGISSVLGISIRNVELIQARERRFRSILQVLAASIDARDPMTSGHSEKVTEFALGICDEMQLEEEFKEMIRVAALLHDYGKIGVPDNILKKPGRLTDEEYQVVKTHAEKTRRILCQIDFEGAYKQVPDIAASHHEKIDGSGYPNGLQGDEIPVGAKIIAVADFFEAITARRHYRGPIPLSKAFEMLKNESGKTLDPKVVEAFISYYEKLSAGEPELRFSIKRVS